MKPEDEMTRARCVKLSHDALSFAEERLQDARQRVTQAENDLLESLGWKHNAADGDWYLPLAEDDPIRRPEALRMARAALRMFDLDGEAVSE